MKPPCDEAVIRSVECRRSAHGASGTLDPGGDNSRFQHGLHRQHRRQCSSARAPSKPPRNRRRCAMGGRVLWVVFGSLDSRRRLTRRLVWPPIDVPDWRRDFRGCFYRLWSCLEHSATRDRTECPRCRSSFSRARQPVDHQRMFRRENSRPSDRYLVRLHCDHNSGGAGSRRLADRACLLALGILH